MERTKTSVCMVCRGTTSFKNTAKRMTEGVGTDNIKLYK